MTETKWFLHFRSEWIFFTSGSLIVTLILLNHLNKPLFFLCKILFIIGIGRFQFLLTFAQSPIVVSWPRLWPTWAHENSAITLNKKNFVASSMVGFLFFSFNLLPRLAKLLSLRCMPIDYTVHAHFDCNISKFCVRVRVAVFLKFFLLISSLNKQLATEGKRYQKQKEIKCSARKERKGEGDRKWWWFILEHVRLYVRRGKCKQFTCASP